MTAPVRTWPQLLATLLRGDDLTADDTRWAMSEVMDDAHEPVAFAGFLIALRAKGETAGEISGLLGALMDRVTPLPVDGSQVVDIVELQEGQKVNFDVTQGQKGPQAENITTA
ncbi:cold shock domain-containing protein [Streptomyces sp. NPDC098077]|uniref:cold shock domain-containing protein n=1 Tax=Streptomyces sp. NPDC098077 TaxID=3366093 RepID=UPI0037FE68F5